MFLTRLAPSNTFEIPGENFIKAQLALDLAAFGIPAVFYSEWTLGMMTGNIVGLPSGDVAALYWSYFVGKNTQFVVYVMCYSMRWLKIDR
jgi:hypothetical protein